MAGAAYCPLSPQDPSRRLETLVKETKSRCVLVDDWSRDKFDFGVTIVDIEKIVNLEWILSDDDFDRLANIDLTSDSIAYVIFTSGSTGIPKAVSCYALSIFI